MEMATTTSCCRAIPRTDPDPSLAHRSCATRGSWTALDLPLEPWFKGRSIGVLDYDADGMLDLFIVEDRYFDGGSSVLLRNLGDLQFEDVTAVGLPSGIEGLGVATADFDGNGFTDLFVSGSNRLFWPATPASPRRRVPLPRGRRSARKTT